MSSPAERYAAARARAARERTALHEFRSLYAFDLDAFQESACEALESGKTVLVAAPTGSGKTVVGEFAVHLALHQQGKCFYTTPIKALSNQKYHDLVERYGAESVGLLTGDNSINGEAPIVVMTTEVLRNMIYAGSDTLAGLRYVVMDEVHYLADRMRGAVWEEVIIHLPEHITVVALSATVSNAEEFGDWLADVRGDTEVIVEEHRPVPLWQHVMADDRLFDLFVDDEQHRVNPDLIRLARDEHRIQRLTRHADTDRGKFSRKRHGHAPYRVDVIDALRRSGLLPAIVFIFSRAGCDAAVQQCLAAGMTLTDHNDREEIRDLVHSRCAHIPDEDLGALGFHTWLDGLERGIASHHAGLLPTFKEVVEELFQRGLLRVVFATETLALGVNMPARSVVLEKLTKWNGESHVGVTPAEYTQLTGRAGRRGIDVEGHAIVSWHAGLDPQALAGLASTRTYPLRSSFRPSYNMAVNLVATYGRATARSLLETSFAQFQADRAVVGLARQVQRNEDLLDEISTGVTCHLGDFAEYFALRQELTAREKGLARAGVQNRREQVSSDLAQLRRGDIVQVSAGRRRGPAVVIDAPETPGEPRPSVLTLDRQVRRVSVVDFSDGVVVMGRMRIPGGFNPRSAHARRDLASSLRERARGLEQPVPHRRRPAADDAEIARLRRALKQHPCHGCSDREEHARWAQRAATLQRETSGLQARVDSRTNSIAHQFDRVCAVLHELGYLTGVGDDAQVTPLGRQLGRIYNEMDLVVAEALRRRLWDGLGHADLAAVVSALVYQSRRDDAAAADRLPGGPVPETLDRMAAVHADVLAREQNHGLSFLASLDTGFVWAAHRWASGHGLEGILRTVDLQPGDFVRWTKQVIDLLDQVAGAAEDPVARTATAAITAMRRGVVAYTSVA